MIFSTKLGFAIALSLMVYTAQVQKIVKVEKVTDHSIHVVGNSFDGVIFTKDYNSGKLENYPSKFTPTIAEILATETLFPELLNKIKDSNPYVIHSLIFIKKNFADYDRQYFGVIDNSKRRIILINFFLKSEEKVLDWPDNDKRAKMPYWQRNLIFVNDGGDSFWQIRINLKAKKVIYFNVNGEA